jgi:hypothetical protein
MCLRLHNQPATGFPTELRVLLVCYQRKNHMVVYQSPRRGLAVFTHGNQKDLSLSKLYKVGFAIIY